MKKQKDFAGNSFGLLAMALIALALFLLLAAGGAAQEATPLAEETPTLRPEPTAEPMPTPLVLRAEEIKILSDYYMLTELGGNLIFGGWSPDGTKMIFYRSEPGGKEPVPVYHVWLANADGSSPRELDPEVSNPKWSPDGRKLAVIKPGPDKYKGELWIIDLESGEEHKVTDLGSGLLDWLTEDTLIFSEEGSLKLVSVDGSNLRDVNISELEGPIWGWFSVSPDGRKILFFDDDHRLWVGRFEGNTIHNLKFLLELPDGLPAWAPDSDRMAFSNGKDIIISDAEGNELARLESVPYEHSLTWSTDGNVLLFIPDLGAPLHIFNADGTGLHPLLEEKKNIGHLQWSPDGRKIAFTEFGEGWQRKIRVLEVGK